MRDVTTLGTRELPELYQGLGDRVSVVKLPKPPFPLHFPAFLPHKSTPELIYSCYWISPCLSLLRLSSLSLQSSSYK